VSERQWSIETLARAHRKVALDANVLIYLLEGSHRLAVQAGAVMDAVEAGQLDGSMAAVGQVEVLAGPAAIGNAAVFEHMADEIKSLGLHLIPLTSDVAEQAAWLRGQGHLELGDAIHVASAKAAGATAMITNDRGIGSRPGLDVHYLADLVSDGQPDK
jgi:predicted nucleic acid-binding protein